MSLYLKSELGLVTRLHNLLLKALRISPLRGKNYSEIGRAPSPLKGRDTWNKGKILGPTGKSSPLKGIKKTSPSPLTGRKTGKPAWNTGKTFQIKKWRTALLGKKFNKLTVLSCLGPTKFNELLWECKCDCGNITTALTSQLKFDGKKSCGCWKKEIFALGRQISLTKGSNFRLSYPKARKTINSLILAGKFSPHENLRVSKQQIQTKKGGTITCQSSWEEKFAKYLDENFEVVSFKKDKIRLKYMYNGKERIYIVDFLVTYSIGKDELVEIKPAAFLRLNENPEKFKVAEEWCLRNNTDFVIITERELELICE